MNGSDSRRGQIIRWIGENFTHDRWIHWSDEQWADALLEMFATLDNTTRVQP